MKIAFVSTEKLPVPALSGGAVQIYIEGVLPYLSRYYEITVFSGTGSGFAPGEKSGTVRHFRLPAEEKSGSVRFIRIPAAKPGQYIDAVRSRLDSSFDLVHIFNRPLWLLSLYESHPKLAYSLSLHNDMFHPDKMTGSEAFECASKARFVTAVSKYIADRTIAYCPAVRDKIHVIYSGVDAGRYLPASGTNNDAPVPAFINRSPDQAVAGQSPVSANTSQSPDPAEVPYAPVPVAGMAGDVKKRKTILFVGRLTPEKGVHVLLRAMKRIMEEREGITLVIAGSKRFGSNESDGYVRSLQALSGELGGRVIFTGFLQPDELIEYYRNADIFVCPSQWNEPLARVLYEAMASGLPIVASDKGGNAEVVSAYENGILVKEYKSHDAVAEAISILLDDPLKAGEMGRAGRELVIAKHGWDRVADNIRRIIDVHAKKI